MKDFFLLWFLTGAMSYQVSLLLDWFILKLKNPWNVRFCIAAMVLGPISAGWVLKCIVQQLLYRRAHKNKRRNKNGSGRRKNKKY